MQCGICRSSYYGWVNYSRCLRKLRRSVLILLIAPVSPVALPAAPIVRDWLKNPAIVRIDTQPDRLFAIGDVHGDYKRLLTLLRRAGLIGPKLKKPEEVQWIGGNAILVQTGDLIDKGPRPVDVIRLLIALRESARRNGGQVVVTMGNHEAEFLAGPNEVKAQDFILDLNRHHIDQKDLLRCYGDIGDFLCSLPFGAKVGDWFFSHGGNTAGRGVTELDRFLQQGVTKDGFAAKELADPNSLLESRLGEGKVWFHPPDKGPDAKKTELQILTANAAALGVKHMAQGHQPSEVVFADGVVRHKGEMFQRWGLLFLIDAGMSRKVKNSKGAVLVIHPSAVTAVCPSGLGTLLWDETSKQDAGRAAPCT
jgi:hypothetical protein